MAWLVFPEVGRAITLADRQEVYHQPLASRQDVPESMPLLGPSRLTTVGIARAPIVIFTIRLIILVVLLSPTLHEAIP